MFKYIHYTQYIVLFLTKTKSSTHTQTKTISTRPTNISASEIVCENRQKGENANTLTKAYMQQMSTTFTFISSFAVTNGLSLRNSFSFPKMCEYQIQYPRLVNFAPFFATAKNTLSIVDKGFRLYSLKRYQNEHRITRATHLHVDFGTSRSYYSTCFTAVLTSTSIPIIIVL